MEDFWYIWVLPVVGGIIWWLVSNAMVKVHSAAPNGSWCGDQRQLSAANGTLN